MKTGRRASIPDAFIGKVRQWHEKGYGCRKIAQLLQPHQVFTTKSSVDRLIHGKPPYATKGIR